MSMPVPDFNLIDTGIDVSCVGVRIGKGTGAWGGRFIGQLGARMRTGWMHPARAARGLTRSLDLLLAIRLLLLPCHRVSQPKSPHR